MLLLGGRKILQRRRRVATTTPDLDTFAMVAQEMDAGQIDKGLWTSVFAEKDGDENKTRAAYIRIRARQLHQSRQEERKDAAA